MKNIKLAILTSEKKSHLQAIQYAIEKDELNAEIVAVWHDSRKDFICHSDIDLVIIAGFHLPLSEAFLRLFAEKSIKIHPSLLPAFPGLDAPKQALEYGVKVSGCTVHYLDGKIIAQAVVPVYESDTIEVLADRILEQECRLLPEIIQILIDNC